MNKLKRTHAVTTSMIALLFAGAFLTACDSNGPGTDATLEVSGAVTDDEGYGKTNARIEGATVTATSVEADGSLRSLSGQATTNAEGRFTLEVEQPSEIIIVQAAKGSFNAQVLVYHTGSARADAMPMTVESKAEADVYVEAKKSDQADAVTAADVAVHVDKQLALEIAAGSATAAQVALAIRNGARAQEEYLRREEPVDDEEIRKGKEQKKASFLELQVSLSAAASASAQAAVVRAFEEAFAHAYLEAGVSAEASAKAHQAGRAALLKFSQSGGLSADARFALRKQAALLTAFATAAAVEAAFKAEGAAQARLEALAQARTDLIAGLRAAASEADLDEAQGAYEAGVKAELAAELSVDAATVETAVDAVLLVKTALDTALSLAASADAIASAHADFYTSAETSARTSLEGSAKADLGSKVLAMLAVQ